MFAYTPCQRMTMKAASTPSGNATTATNAERKCHRNSTHTKATTMNSSMSFSVKLSTAPSISCDAIVGGHDLHARRQAPLQFVELRLHRLDRRQRVLPGAHDDHPAGDFAFAIQFGDAATHRPARRTRCATSSQAAPACRRRWS